MPDRDSHTTGAPSWVDVSTPDLAAGKEFYTELFGWEYSGGGEQFGGYSNALLRDRLVAGISPVQPGDGTPPHWGTYLHTEDIAATVARVREAGGTVVAEPFPVGDFGAMAVAIDPTGAAIRFWQPATHPGAQVHAETGAVVWNELRTTDVAAAKSFYGKVFGYDFSEVAGAPEFPVFELGGEQVASAEPVHAETEAPHWLVYFGTSDVDDTVARTLKLGGRLVEEQVDTAYGRMAVLADPWGAVFAVLQVGE